MHLNLRPNLSDPDDIYAQIISGHDGLDDEASQRLNARLILILINHIGEPGVIAEAISAARLGVVRDQSAPSSK